MDLRVALAGLLAALCLALPARVEAREPSRAPGSTSPPALEPTSLPEKPPSYRLSAARAVRIARRSHDVASQSERYGRLRPLVEAKPPFTWQVGFFAADDEVVQVLLDDPNARIRESWTGHHVAWRMARGYEGQFGHKLNAPYVWIPLSLIFLFGLFDFRRPGRIAHLDLLVLLSFGIGHVFFNRGEIGLSVPLAYPPLLYLLGRMLWIGLRGRGSGLRPSLPIAWLAAAAVFLLAFRIALNVGDSGVIDVGYAGVIGADRIAQGQPLYGEGAFPDDNPTGDTYGPANYYAYVPFELALPWGGEWDALPAAHGAAIFFDLAAAVGLFVLGMRLGGRGLGVVLVFAWLAYPYTAFALQSNANDALIGAALVWALALFSSPVARGGLLAVAATAKFAPLALAPLFAVGTRGLSDRLEGPDRLRGAALVSGLRPVALFARAFVALSALTLAYPAVDPGLATFWDRTLESQLNRESPFSVWGQQPGLQWLQTTVVVLAAALAVLLAFIPRGVRSIQALAALSAALLIAVQLTAEHWFYLYIPWFFGLAIAALSRTDVRLGEPVQEVSEINQARIPGAARSIRPARPSAPGQPRR